MVAQLVSPVLACVAALLALASPLTRLLIYGEPFGAKGSASEWIMLALAFAVPVVLLAAFWRGRMNAGLSLRRDFSVFLFLAGSPVVNLILCIIGGFWQILWLVTVAAIAMWALLAMIYLAGRRVPQAPEREVTDAAPTTGAAPHDSQLEGVAV